MTRARTEHRTIAGRSRKRIPVECRSLAPIVMALWEDSYLITGGRRVVRKTPVQLSPQRTAREVSSIFREAQRGFARSEEEFT